MMCGLPVVSIRHPSTDDLLTNGVNALLSEPDDVDALGQCLEQFCKSPELRKRFSEAQKSKAEALWSWDERMEVEVRELEKVARLATYSLRQE